jgi:transcriptional regulator of acetoin/glycerol metabolism
VRRPPAALGDLGRSIVDVLNQLSGNRMAAARVLGISRRALYRRLERHHIEDAARRPVGRRS